MLVPQRFFVYDSNEITSRSSSLNLVFLQVDKHHSEAAVTSGAHSVKDKMIRLALRSEICGHQDEVEHINVLDAEFFKTSLEIPN